ncbi:hypothetical protein D8674_037774 [Pyrus ussuriensis x Pyrus communis]|uniref:Uncharacterized protein n=1 Tax=Pyrus ussuriensis x Pyrus communis TaxID=2448454 RepID=A0A5N5FN81_9ROSA|nr:hypothetical protein D8674_037774 [Pyrus ussuriensis x Pyrus communis]
MASLIDYVATSRNWIDHEEDVLLTIPRRWLLMVLSKKCVVVDSDEILQEWVKKHPNASCKPNKPFPLYPRLCTVFGRDRAMGMRIVRLLRFLRLHLPHLLLLLHLVQLNLLGRGRGVGMIVMQILYLLSVKVGIKLLLK